jgi:glycosyltransferase involved in cell wall biosynthesis
MTESGPGRVVMVVPNRIDGDSRVQKAAASMAEAGWDVHLMGITDAAKKERYEQDGAQIHKIPLPRLEVPKSLRRRVAAIRFPLAYSSKERAKQRKRRIKAGWIELEARDLERGRGLHDGLLRTPWLVRRVGRKLQRIWINRRAAQTGARDRFLLRTEGRLERIERRWWTLLLGDRAWQRLDITFRRLELAFRPEILRLQPDLIHVHDTFPLGICVRAADHMRVRGKDAKILYDAHEYVPGFPDVGNASRWEALVRYERRYIQRADAVATVSEPLADLLQERHGLERRPAVVLNAPIGFGPARPHPGDVRSDCGLGDEVPLAVYAGWVAPERQLEVIIEAAREIPELHLAFLVTHSRLKSPYGRSLVELGEAYGMADRMHFRGYVHYTDLPRYLETADLGIHPMPTGPVNHEIALPNKFFEYGHARLPLVVTNVATMSAEVRRLGIGEVFTSGDAASLAAAIGKVLADGDQYRRAYRDPALLSQYTWERQALEYTRLYESLIGPAPRPVAPVAASRDALRERCGVEPGVPVVAVMDSGVDDAWTDAAVRGLAGLKGVRTAIVCPDPARRDRFAGSAEGAVAVVPTGPMASFLATASAVVLPRAERGDTVSPYLALSLDARVPVIVPASPSAERITERLGVGAIAEATPAAVAAAAERLLTGRRPSANPRVRARLGSATPWPPLAETAIRLGLGTANYAGQLAEIARAVSWHRADTSAEVVGEANRSVLRFPADRSFSREEQADPAFQQERMRRVLDDYTHLMVDALKPVFGWLHGTDVAGDLPVLREARVRTALLMHGSEVRDPDAHLERHEHSPYRRAPGHVLAALRDTTRRHREIAADSGLPLFVTTPDLIDDVPKARWIPLTVDVDGWYCDAPVMERARPVVLHAPSRRWTKGTDAVVPVLERMHEAGAIDFRLVEGLAPARMREVVWGADIVVDQVAIGSYGAFACEAMAAGKPVIAYLCESAAERMGGAPPVVNATAATLEDAIMSLLDDRDRAREIGLESLRFARRVHDGRAAAEVLREFLES